MLNVVKMVRIDRSAYITVVFIVFGLNGMIGLARLLLYASLLGPAAFGMFSISQLLVTVGAYLSTLGFIEALNRQVPVLIGERKEKCAEYLLSLGLGFSLCVALIISLFFVVTVFNFSALQRYESIFVVGVLLVSTVFFNLVCSGIRGKSLTLEAGGLTLLKTVIAAILGIIVAPVWGVPGIIFVEASALFIVSIYALHRYLPNVLPVLRLKGRYKSMIGIGLPFLIGNIVLNLSQTIDSWFAQSVFDQVLYGQYAFAMIIFIAGQNFTSIIAQYVQPRVLTEFGRTKNHLSVLGYLHKVASVVSLLFIIGWFPFDFSLTYALAIFYPEYLEVSRLSLYIYIGTGAMGVLGVYESYVLARQKGKMLMSFYSLIFFVVFLLCWFAKFNQLGLVYYAIIFCIGRVACLFVVVLINKYLVVYYK